MNKCEICKVYVSCFNQEKGCAFEHNGDKDICPFEDEYLDLSVHDEKVRADEKTKVLEEVMAIVKAKISEKEYPIETMIELTDLGGKIQQLNNSK